jgi:hypothetical protein
MQQQPFSVYYEKFRLVRPQTHCDVISAPLPNLIFQELSVRFVHRNFLIK